MLSLLCSHLHMAFPERDRRRAAAARKERFFLSLFAPPLPPPSIFSLPRLSLSSPPPLANDLAPEMPYGDDCGGGYKMLIKLLFIIIISQVKKKLFSVHPSQFFQVGRAVFFFFFFFFFAMRFILSLIYSGAPVCTYNSVIMKQRFHCSL